VCFSLARAPGQASRPGLATRVLRDAGFRAMYRQPRPVCSALSIGGRIGASVLVRGDGVQRTRVRETVSRSTLVFCAHSLTSTDLTGNVDLGILDRSFLRSGSRSRQVVFARCPVASQSAVPVRKRRCARRFPRASARGTLRRSHSGSVARVNHPLKRSGPSRSAPVGGSQGARARRIGRFGERSHRRERAARARGRRE